MRPKLTTDEATAIVSRLYGVKVTEIKALMSYDDKNYHILIDKKHNNPYINDINPGGYVFKVLNAEDSKHGHVDAEHEMQNVLSAHGFLCPKAVINLNGQTFSKELLAVKSSIADKNANDQYEYHICRLMTFVPGRLLRGLSCTDQLLYKLGQYIARMHQVLKDFDHEELHSNHIYWLMSNVSMVRPHIHLLKDPASREMIEDVVTRLEKEVLQNPEGLRKGAIHGDLNDDNVLVEAGETRGTDCTDYSIKGIIDFGDCTYTYLILDLAISTKYLMELHKDDEDFFRVGRQILKGYQSMIKLTERELSVFRLCVAARFTQSTVYAARTYATEPDESNAAVDVENALKQLTRLWNTPEDEIRQLWELE